MQLLTILTVIYAVVLVLALAISLIAILVGLRRVTKALGEVRAALATVPADTAPLESVLRAVQDTAGVVAGDIEQAQQALERTDKQLGAVADRLGAAQVAR